MAEIDPAALRILLDKQQIHDVMMRYCRSVDRMDVALLRTCYWPDAHDDHGPFKGSAAQFLEIVGGLSDAYAWSQHLICNEYVEVDGDVAHGECYFLMPAGIGSDDARQVWTLGGRYVDRFERRDGEWRIADRVVVQDWETTVPAAPAHFVPNPFVQGRRSTDDAVYRPR